ncbi:hypothetical protein AC249_AIPGENE19292 [Exaiptasia diaphana]|nr:hypothetical protein AC249_AIPGENE19292 [Exaiptasia diaphana]
MIADNINNLESTLSGSGTSHRVNSILVWRKKEEEVEATQIRHIISFLCTDFEGNPNVASLNLSTSGTIQGSSSSPSVTPGRRPCRCQQCGTVWSEYITEYIYIFEIKDF